MAEPSNSYSGKHNGGENANIANIHPMRIWRKETNMTLDDLSFLTGFSMASLSRIERYKQYPLISAAQKIIAISKGSLKPEDFFGKVE